MLYSSLYGQTMEYDSTIVEISTITLSRDKAEYEETRQFILDFRNKDPELRDAEMIASMQREISQLRNKIMSARMQVGRDRASIVEELNVHKGNRNAEHTHKMKQKVKEIKADQRAVKKLEKYMDEERRILKKFEDTEVNDRNIDRVIELLDDFARVMENEIMWTQRELSEDKRQLKS